MTHLSTVETLEFTQVLFLTIHSCYKCHIIIERILIWMDILISQLFLNEVIPQPIPLLQFLSEYNPIILRAYGPDSCLTILEKDLKPLPFNHRYGNHIIFVSWYKQYILNTHYTSCLHPK